MYLSYNYFYDKLCVFHSSVCYSNAGVVTIYQEIISRIIADTLNLILN